MRKAITATIAGNRLVGTYHQPREGAGTQSAPRDVGILIFNFAQLPRAGLGDMPVQLADAHAEIGFHAFRFDMPGLGDSPGHYLDSVRSVWAFTEEGGHAAHAAELVQQLNQQYNLRGMIVGGLCGGAITSVFAADRLPAGVLGLILLEPSYYRVGSAGAPMPGKTLPKKTAARSEKLAMSAKIRSAMKDKSDTGWLSFVRKGYVWMSRGKDMLVGPRFPDVINLPLVDASRRVAGRSLPILLVTAGDSQRWLNRFQIFGRVKGRRVTFVEIEGTNHMLVPGGGKAQVVRHVNSWLATTFS